MLLTIQKASDVLALYDYNHTEWGVREVAEQLRLAKSSAHDLLSSLAQAGFLRKTPEGRYRLGWRLVSMSEILLNTTELRQVAHPVLEELADQHAEAVHLAILDSLRLIYLDKLEGRQAVRVELALLGTRLYPHCLAEGKVLLAYRSRDEVECIFQADGLPRLTPNTITDREELYRALEKIRKQGYAYDLEEAMPDLCGVSAPVFNHTGQVVAAVSMSTPVYRFLRMQADYRADTIRAGRLISERLGYFGR